MYWFVCAQGALLLNSSSEEGEKVVNGMSYSKRDGENANSAIVVTVTPNDFDGDSPLAGIDFQRVLETEAYKEGAGLVPLQKYGDFKNNVKTADLGTITPNIKGKYTLSNLNNIFPNFIVEPLIEGIESFWKKNRTF